MTNPLLTDFLLPSFSSIHPEHIVPAMQIILKRCRETIELVVSQQGPFTWENLCQPIDEVDNQLDIIWSLVNHLNDVKNSPDLRAAYNQGLALLSEYNTWFGHNKNLYDAYTNLRNGKYYNCLNQPKQKAINNILRDFQLSGINLTTEKQQRYGQITIRLSELGSTYSNNVLDASMGWSKLITDKADISGMPESWLSAAYARAADIKQDGWLLTLDMPTYLPLMTYCDNQSLRFEMYRAYNTRASDQGPNAGKWDNSKIIIEIITLRQELATILGFNSYANKSLTTKMAKEPKTVLYFLNHLVNLSLDKGKKEFSELCYFAKKHYNCDTIYPWDFIFYSEKQKQHLFGISEEQLRPYFPENKVVNGMFKVVNNIYGIYIKERGDVDLWHPEVKFFDVFDLQGELRGSLYIDLYARNNKRSGAWMNDCISMMRKSNGNLQKPVAYIICNFNRPVSDDQPALFTHSEVITLFHEFGHGIHHIMTEIDTPGISGINGVPWDAVEIASQFMENYCWQSESLAFISSHYRTGESLHPDLLNKLLGLRNYQAAIFILRQLELGLFDLRIHNEFSSDKGEQQILNILNEVKKQISIVPSVDWSRFACAFSHIFAGGYDAGYYSYLWSDVLAADIWSSFKKEGILNHTTGELFLKTFLSQGGVEDPMKLLTRFQGCEPKLDSMMFNYCIEREILS